MWILSFFQLSYIGIFVVACALLIISFSLFRSHKETYALAALFACALLLRLFMALQDPFLHIWDERYHALVARNMMNNPLLPLLRGNPIGGYDMHYWTNSHVWLHKQPLFLWQMALSMKIFGVSDFSIRYPSVLMGALMVLMTYSIARTLTGSRNIAYCSALIFCFCGHQLEMISGVMGMDHNDVSYGFYVLASIWAYTKYVNDNRFLYTVLIGVFAGCAVLNKWLPGMMIFGAWTLNIIWMRDNWRRGR